MGRNDAMNGGTPGNFPPTPPHPQVPGGAVPGKPARPLTPKQPGKPVTSGRPTKPGKPGKSGKSGKKKSRPASADEMFPGFAQDKKRSGKLPVIVGSVIGILALGYLGTAAAVAGTVPKGASFAGVPVGGMKPEAAIKKLDSDLGDKLNKPFPVKLGAKTTNIDPATAGLQPDFVASIHSVADFSLNPVKIVAHIFGTGELELSSKIADESLSKAVSAAAGELKTAPTEAGFNCQAGELKPITPAPGRDLDVEKATELLREKWWTQGKTLELPGKSSAPKSTQAHLDDATEGVAKTLMSGPVKMNVGDQAVEIPPEELCQDVTWSLQNDDLKASFDGEKLKTFTLEHTQNLEKAPVNAGFSFDTGAPTVVASTDGTRLDPKDLAARVEAGATSADNREVTVDLTPVAPEFSTEDANNAGVKEIIGEFATNVTADQTRTRNLALGAKKMTGRIYKTGEQFSLEEALGPITAENGWGYAGVVENGIHKTGLGGGLSQVCVTTLNAAWFAGMDLIEFHPHSEWYTRYPAGRECTLWSGTLDLKWKNPNPTAVVMQGWVGGGQLHVRVWGTKYYTVESSQSGKSGIVAPRTVVNNSPECLPSGAGQPGFSITNTRTRYLDGKKVDSKSYTHTYVPQNNVVCAKDLAAQQAAQEQAAAEGAGQNAPAGEGQ